MSFHVGQKVVCVDDAGHGRYTPFPAAGSNLEGLRKGAIYTVRWVGVSLGCHTIRVEEIIRSYNSVIDEENVYAAARFRPIQERKTDISFAHEILKKVTRKQTERA